MNDIKISLIAAELSTNTLNRPYSIAKALEGIFNVEILGPQFGDEVWEPLQGEFEFVDVPGRLFPMYLQSMRQLIQRIDGDIVYVITPRFTNLVPGLLAARRHDIPWMVDIVDMESAPQLDREHPIYRSIREFPHPHALPHVLLAERLVRYADHVTVVSSYLQSQFGGEILPQVRDTSRMDPAKFDRQALREQYGLAEQNVVLFLGTPQPYKGLDTLVDSVNDIDLADTCLAIVGVDSEDDIATRLLERDDGNVRLFGKQPFSKIPKFQAMADVVAVPQKETPVSRAQIPMKIIDAMAMGNPVVASDVSDIPSVVDCGGLIVPPGDTVVLTETLERVLLDETLREELGSNARRRCVDNYDFESIRETLTPVIEALVE